MSSIYLLFALFSQFSSANFLASVASAPAQVYISFDQANGIGVGAPVVVEGEVVGSVTNVSVPTEPQSAAKPNSLNVQISVKPEHRERLKLGTVALAFSPLSSDKKKSDTVLELFVPRAGNNTLLADGSQIRGYSSYEQFWSAGGSDFRLHPDSLFKS